MQRSLTDTVRTVRSGSESIATATRQIAAGNIDLSSRTENRRRHCRKPRRAWKS
jgi:methyl-accepting chemotaxis protein-1 (serine sensor receptor)